MPEDLLVDDLPDEVVPEDLPLADFEVLAFVVEDLDVEPEALLLLDDEPPVEPEDDVRPLLLPDVLDDEDDEGVLDDPLDMFDD